MHKNFWPVFIIVAAVGAAAIWTQTPRFVTSLPDCARDIFRTAVRKAHTLIAESKFIPTPVPPEPVIIGGGTTPAEPEKDSPANVQTTTSRTVVVQADAPAVPVPPSRPSTPPAVSGSLAPSDIKGVKVVNTSSAEWCVLTRSTPIESLDEKPLGTASGGRFFVIERRARAADGKLLIGNFTPKKLSQPVQINSRYAPLCLSGSPDELTTAQLHALKMYYQLRGEALDYLEEVRKTKGDSASPFYRKLAEAERIRDFRAKELAGMNTLSGDQKAVELAELEKLKDKAAEIRSQHEDWKRAHSAQISDPARDPHYQELVGEYRRYAASLPDGLAVE